MNHSFVLAALPLPRPSEGNRDSNDDDSYGSRKLVCVVNINSAQLHLFAEYGIGKAHKCEERERFSSNHMN